jgi:transposase
MRARHLVSKLLLRQGLVYSGGTAWTVVHSQWLHAQHFDSPDLRIAYREALEVACCVDRRDRLDTAIEQTAHADLWAGTVARLEGVRGIATLTAFGFTVEIGDWHRFSGATIGAYLGLTPSEFSSGSSRSQGPISGNGHARRLLVEVAWHHRRGQRAQPHPARPTGHHPTRRAGPGPGSRRPPAPTLEARNKRSTVAAVAIARVLAGWCWSLAVMDT